MIARRSLYALWLALSSAVSAQSSFVYTTVDPPGSTSTIITGMNKAGEIVGSYTDPRGTHNFLRSADGSTYTTIDLSGATPGATTIGAINNAGQIAGTYVDPATGFSHCYIGSQDGSTFTPFDIPDSGPGFGPRGLNDNGVVSGVVLEISASASEGFVRSPDGSITIIQFEGGTRVRGIDNDGDIVGWYVVGGSGEGVAHGFIRNAAGVFTTFDLPGTDSFTSLTAIDNRGRIAGYWGDGLGFVGVADGSFPMLAVPNALATYPAAIDDSGLVAGYYSDGTTNHGFLAVPAASTQPAIRAYPPGVIPALAFGGAPGITPTAAPGGWIEIYGENLAPATRAWAASDFTGSTAPTSLNGVSVSVNGAPAYVSYISPGQVNALLPSTVAAGSANITVTNGPQTSAVFTLTINTTQPGLLVLPRTDNNASQYLGAVFPDFMTYVLPPGYTSQVPTNRAQPGDTIVLFGVGLGPVNPPVPIGQIAAQASTMASPPVVSFNGTPAMVTYAGLMPGTVALYQINVVVPNIAMPPGQTFNDSVPVVVQVNGKTLPSGPIRELTLPIEQ